MKYASIVAWVGLVVSVAGCPAKGKLDDRVDALAGALGACDRDKFDAIAADALEKDLPEPKFRTLCETVTWLGPLREKSQTGISVGTGGTKGNYDLTFEKGELKLELHLDGDDIVLLEFTGDDWKKAVHGAELARYSEFKVYESKFLTKDDAPNPGGSTYAPGPVRLRMLLGGVQPGKGNNFDVHLRTKILAPDGAVKWESPAPEVLSMPAPPGDDIGVLTVNNNLNFPDAGMYQVQMTLEDVASDKKTTYSMSVTIR